LALIFNFALEYAIRKTRLLAYAEDVDLLADYKDTLKKVTEILVDASKEVGLEVDVALMSAEFRVKSCFKYSEQVL
jgi:hypothetical protein